MKIYDITQELFGGRVYPGDPMPSYERVLKIAEGAPCNLTKLQLGAHNATHVDAPYHFYDEGKTIEEIELFRCVGPCTVIEPKAYEKEDWIQLLETSQKRILIKGNYDVTSELAKLFNQYGILLVGVEGQSVGPADFPMPVHLELLSKEVVLLEGIVLKGIEEGVYFLSAAPIKLGGGDGAPCRAILISFDKTDTCNC